MKLDQYSEYIISTVVTDALVLQHQGISSHRAEYASMCFQLFMGWFVKFNCRLVMLLFLLIPDAQEQRAWGHWLWKTLNTFIHHCNCEKTNPPMTMKLMACQPPVVSVFNPLWSSDAMWWHRSGSTLVQVMACCLMAPSHYLNQCWLLIRKVQWHLSKGN